MAMNLTAVQMEAIFERHMQAELRGDLAGTMATMTAQPHITNVPIIAGGVGFEGVRNFYNAHLVGKFFPPDYEFVLISRTIGSDQLVDEVVLKFTHSMMIDWLLPNIAPTGKYIEIALVVIVKFADSKIAHEHIYWDQASVLVQLGLLDPTGLPVIGVESAQKIQFPKRPVKVW